MEKIIIELEINDDIKDILNVSYFLLLLFLKNNFLLED